MTLPAGDGTKTLYARFFDAAGNTSALVGDTVVLNTTAVALGLGTGGFHLVVAVERGPDAELGHPGRVIKARYTPLQAATLSVEESHRDVLESSPGLQGVAVVSCPLHSMIAPVAAGARAVVAADLVGRAARPARGPEGRVSTRHGLPGSRAAPPL